MYNLDLKEFGFNAFPNMMIIAKYLSLGGGMILQYKDCKPGFQYYYDDEISNTPSYDNPINISNGLITVYNWMKNDKLEIEKIGLFIDDFYKLYTTSNQTDRTIYVLNKHKENRDLHQEGIVFITKEEFVNRIINVHNNSNFDISINDFNKLFDIPTYVQQESALNVLRYNKNKMTGDSLDIPV